MNALSRPLRVAHGWANACLDFLYPRICPLCWRRLLAEETTICARCIGAMRPPADWRCERCLASGRGAAPDLGRRCRLCPPDGAWWQGAIAASGYFEAAARCVHLFKYQRRRELGEAMAAIMQRELEESLRKIHGRIACVVPVPIHWRRRFLRGFNQSDLLAETLAASMQMPYRPELVRRVKHTAKQALLPRDRRAENVRDAFAVGDAESIRGAGVLLVDDVVTTGETINECARALREAGAAEIWVACFARAGAGAPDAFDDDWLPDISHP